MNHLLAVLPLLLATAPAAAQTLLQRSSTGPLIGEGEGARAIPAMRLQPSWGGYYPQAPNPVPGLPPFPLDAPPASAHLPSANGFPYGDLAFDNQRGLVIETDGDRIATHVHETYLAPGAVPTVAVSPRSPWLPGRLTGIAVDPQTQRLWCTDGTYLQATSIAAPNVPQTLTVVFGFAVHVPPMTGLDWDPVVGHLVGCDAGGNLYRFTGTGAPVGAQPWRAGPPGYYGEATDVAVPHLAIQTDSSCAWVQFRNLGAVEYRGPGNWGSVGYTVENPPAPGTEAGIAIHYGALPRRYDCGCPHGAFLPMLPNVIGQAQAGFALHNVAPGTPVFLLIDIVPYAPGQPPACYSYLGVSPAPLLSQFTLAGNDGRAAFPVPLMIAPTYAGLECFVQSAFLCQGPNPIGVSSLLNFQLGLP